MIRSLNQDFFKVWSPKMAYVLGYFAADGSLIKNKRSGPFIEFTSCDRELLQIVKGVTSASQCIARRASRNDAWKTQYRIQIGSKEWFNDLTKLGFSVRKSKVLAFPKIPEPILRHFIRGYFDGDGCVYFKKHFSKFHKKEIWVFNSSFISGSNDFLKILHKTLQTQGITGGSIANKERGFALVFSRHDSLALYELMYNTGQVMGLFVARKRKKFEEAIHTLYPMRL